MLYTTILFYSCVLFHLHSLVSHKQLPSCLHSSIKEHSVIPCVPFPLFSLFHTKTVSFLFTHSYTHAFCSTHALNFVLHSILSNTVDSIYIVSYKLYSLVLTYSQFQSLQLASHTHSVLLMRSIPSIQSFPHKNSQFLVYTQLHTRILFCPCVQLSLCSLCCQIQSTPSILSATNSTVWYLHTVSVNHYNLLNTHILFYSCVLFPLFSLFHTKTVSFLFTLSYTHAFCSAHAFNFRFAVYAVKYSRLHLYCQLQTVLSDTYIQSVSIITTCFTHTFRSTHAFYSLYSVFSTQKQSVSCLHTVTHTHFVLPMRSTFALQSMLSNTVDSIYIVSYKQYCLILTYSQCQSLQLA